MTGQPNPGQSNASSRDIQEESELRRALAQAANSEQRLRDILTNANEGFVLYNEWGEHLEVNPRYCAILGMSEEDLLGLPMEQFLDEESQKLWAQATEPLEALQPCSLNLVILRADGKPVPAMVNLSPVSGTGSMQTGFYALISDISELTEREQQLREKEEQIRLLLESVTEGILGVDLQGMVTFSNPEASNLLGVARNQIDLKPSHDLLQLIGPDDQPIPWENSQFFQTLTRGTRVTNQEVKIRRLDSTIFHAEMSSTPLTRNGKLVGAVMVFRDITETLNMSLNFLALLENSSDYLFIKDTQGQYRIVNQQFALVNGFAHWRDVIGKTDYDLFPQEMADQFWQEDRDVLDKGNPVNGAIHAYVGIAGDARYEKTSKRPFFDSQGKIVGLFGIASDITDLKHLNDELARAKETAESATRAKSSFLANMSHEIRTPMNAILGISTLLGRTELDQRQQDYLDKISSAGKNLLGIINDILDFSKIEAGKMELESVQFQLSQILGDLQSIIEIRCQEKGLALHLEIDPDIPPSLVGDPLRLTQILLNLTSNAIKFTHSGTITLCARLSGKSGDKVTLRFRVQDTGIGIDSRSLRTLFQHFTQIDPSVSRKYGGTGLGLSITKRLVEMHGGKIWVDSIKGQGTTFFFTVELGIGTSSQQDQREAGYEHLSSQLGKLLPLTVLVVDDNDINGEILTELLEAEGIDVHIAKNGKQAIQALQDATSHGISVHAILMDLQMPEMDGYAASRFIRSDQAYTDIPIIAVSADAIGDVEKRVLDAGMNALVTKPIDLNELFRVLLRWLGQDTPENLDDQDPQASLEVIDSIDEPADRYAQTDLHELEPVEEPIPSLPGWDIAKGLRRIRGNRILFKRLMETFFRMYQTHIQDWNELWTNGSREQQIHWVHTLKGTSGNLGIESVYQATALVNEALNSDTSDTGIQSLVQDMHKTLIPIIEGLDQWFGSFQKDSPVPGSPSQEAHPDIQGKSALYLQSLLGFLIQNDSRATRIARDLYQELEHSSQKHLCREIVRACEDFEYEAALALARQL